MEIKSILILEGSYIKCQYPDNVNPALMTSHQIYLCIEYDDNGNTKQIIFDTNAFNSAETPIITTWANYKSDIQGLLETYAVTNIAPPNYMIDKDGKSILTPFGVKYKRPILRYPDSHEGLNISYGNISHPGVSENNYAQKDLSHDLIIRTSDEMHYWLDMSQSFFVSNGFITRSVFDNSDIHHPYLASLGGSHLIRGCKKQTFQTMLIDFSEMLPEGYPKSYPVVNDRGSWVTDTLYRKGDMVDYSGTKYICVNPNNNSDNPSVMEDDWIKAFSDMGMEVTVDDPYLKIDLSSIGSPNTDKALVLFGKLYMADDYHLIHDKGNDEFKIYLTDYEIHNLKSAFSQAIWNIESNTQTFRTSSDLNTTAYEMCLPFNQCFVLDFGKEGVYHSFTDQFWQFNSEKRVMPAGASGIIRNKLTGKIKTWFPHWIGDNATLINIVEDDLDMLIRSSGTDYKMNNSFLKLPRWFSNKYDPGNDVCEIMEIFST